VIESEHGRGDGRPEASYLHEAAYQRSLTCPLSVAGRRAVEARDYSPARYREQRRHSVVTDVEAHITGTVWKIEVEVGDSVAEGDTVVVLESMKMEMPVEAEDPGVVAEIRCEEGQSVAEGDTLVVLE
jgi:acetyl-CoA carboxylase biotin carboxyl carrier protein